MRVSAKSVGLTHDKIYEDHVGEVLYLDHLLNCSFVEFTAIVFAV